MNVETIRTPDHPAFARSFALYESSFPLHERRTRAMQEGVLSHKEYRYEVVTQGEEFVGILLLWEGATFYYVEHFAIHPTLRGGGYGAQVLQQLCARGKEVVLEIDPPIDAISQRRQRFYQRAGFHVNPHPHVHPPYRGGFSGHPLVVMSYPSRWDITKQEQFAAYLQDTVMADCKGLGFKVR